MKPIFLMLQGVIELWDTTRVHGESWICLSNQCLWSPKEKLSNPLSIGLQLSGCQLKFSYKLCLLVIILLTTDNDISWRKQYLLDVRWNSLKIILNCWRLKKHPDLTVLISGWKNCIEDWRLFYPLLCSWVPESLIPESLCNSNNIIIRDDRKYKILSNSQLC